MVRASLDTIGAEILEQLSSIQRRLDSIESTSCSHKEKPDSIVSGASQYVAEDRRDRPTTFDALRDVSMMDLSCIVDQPTVDDVTIPTAWYANTLEDILCWPVLGLKAESIAIRNCILNTRAAKGPERGSIGSDEGRVTLRQGINEDEVTNLVEQYLQNVYPKNPVVDRGSLERWTSYITEHGFSWDAESCFVVSTRISFNVKVK